MGKPNYDGWVIKSCWGRKHSFLIWTFEQTRTEAIAHWGGNDWKKQRKSGDFKLVKVKLVEVE